MHNVLGYWYLVFGVWRFVIDLESPQARGFDVAG